MAVVKGSRMVVNKRLDVRIFCFHRIKQFAIEHKKAFGDCFNRRIFMNQISPNVLRQP